MRVRKTFTCFAFYSVNLVQASSLIFICEKWDVTMISDFWILWFPSCVLLLFLGLFLCLILFLLCFFFVLLPVCLISKEGEKKPGTGHIENCQGSERNCGKGNHDQNIS